MLPLIEPCVCVATPELFMSWSTFWRSAFVLFPEAECWSTTAQAFGAVGPGKRIEFGLQSGTVVPTFWFCVVPRAYSFWSCVWLMPDEFAPAPVVVCSTLMLWPATCVCVGLFVFRL